MYINALKRAAVDVFKALIKGRCHHKFNVEPCCFVTSVVNNRTLLQLFPFGHKKF